MPRFVVLRHEFPPGHGRQGHWDLMFERAGALRTWSVNREPLSADGAKASELADHRMDYLDYEGPISDDRGSVKRWDAGEYRLEEESHGLWVVTLGGARLTGRMTFELSQRDHSWRVSFAAAPING